MTRRVLFVNPWIHDFSAFNLWARPLGLLQVAEHVSLFDTELRFLDCVDAGESNVFGCGKYRSVRIQKPAVFHSVPRYYKRYGISPDEFSSRIRSHMPFDLVLMTSGMAYWYPGVQETIRMLRTCAGDVPVILGGSYARLYPEHTERYSGADLVFTGRSGEELDRVLVQFGLSRKTGRAPVRWYSLHPYSRHPFAPLLTSSGCPFNCSYCASSLLFPRYSRRPVENIVTEMEELISLGVRDFAFYDDALLHQPEQHIKPLLEIVTRKEWPVRLHAPNGLHARFIDNDLARLMRRAGFHTVRLSLETIDAVRQERTGGKIETGRFEQAVLLLKKNGFTKEHLGAYLMYGLPGQEFREVEQGVDFLKKIAVRIHLAEFSPIRGTGCWHDLVRQGTISDDIDPLLTNNTTFPFLFSGYDTNTVGRLKVAVQLYNRAA